jgi:Flp pilus assembly protein TadG
MDKRRFLGLFDLWHDRRGAFAPIAALMMTALLGFGALAIDMGFNYYTRNKLQVTADSSALAGASQLDQLPDETPMVTEALDYADKNMAFADYGNVLVAADVVAGNWEPDTRTFTAGLDPMNAVMTTTRQQEASGNPVPAFLGGIAGFSSYDITASAIATWGVGDDIFPSGCIMALSPDEDEAFKIFGTATVTASDCSIEVASTAPCAMDAHGTPTITYVEGESGEGINVAGGYCEKGNVNIDPPPNQDYTGDIQDPYRNTDPCEQGLNCDAACDYTDATFTDSQVIQPGVYCGGITWTGSGTATFAEGDYIIREGALDIGGNVAIDGSAGVGFYLQGTGSVVNFKGHLGDDPGGPGQRQRARRLHLLRGPEGPEGVAYPARHQRRRLRGRALLHRRRRVEGHRRRRPGRRGKRLHDPHRQHHLLQRHHRPRRQLHLLGIRERPAGGRRRPGGAPGRVEAAQATQD